jgi:hypothetical protein
MSWLSDWQALHSRIQGLLDAGTFFFRAMHTSSADDRSVKKKVLLKNAKKIFDDLNGFKTSYESILPTAAYDSLNRFLTDDDIRTLNFNPTETQARGNVQLALTSLVAFCSEFTYLIADTQAIARRITERAFIHLQRSIIVDSDIRSKWTTSFGSGEPACEKFGSIHLLSHGVWAFKANAIGGQTDLILNESLPPLSIIESAADALVLTEWKKVNNDAELNDKIQEAQRQAAIYSAGVLGGIELANYRYLVMVSERMMEMPDNRLEGVVTYRHINIAVNPASPSVEARTV